MNPPVSRITAEHYSWGAGCDGWHLVRSASLSVIEERMPAGTSEARHFHRQARQFFYVIQGVLTIEHPQGIHTLSASYGLEVPPGVVHEVRNDSAEAVRFLVVSQPPSHGDRETIPAEAAPNASS